MKILLVDNGTKNLPELQGLIPGCELTVSYDKLDTISFLDFELIVLSGSSTASVQWQHANYKDEMELILGSRVPLIGICFGCEMIAYAFGGSLRELVQPHAGVREIHISDASLSGKKTLAVYEHHRWIIENLPSEFEVIAYSDDGPEAIKHKVLPIYGLQFHPEKCGEETETRAIFTRLISSLTKD